MITLGINAAFHDSAACLVDDGRLIGAAEDERFTGIKHGKRPIPFSAYELPFNAIDYCLSEAGVAMEQVDHVAYSFNPFLLTGPLTGHETMTLPFEPSRALPEKTGESPWNSLFLSHIVNAPRHLRGGWPHHLQERFFRMDDSDPYRWHWVDHHLAHAASAFLPSPFSEAAVLCLDGRGEIATTSYWLGSDHNLESLGQVNLPHSLGLLYERATEHLGFLHSSDEYKVMALASFGQPAFADELRERIRIEGGQYEIAPRRLGVTGRPPTPPRRRI